LSLATGETYRIVERKKLKFVFPNKEIKELIDTKLMDSFYEMTLKSKCNSEERNTLVLSAGTNEFTKNLNRNLLQKIPYSKINPKPEAYFESMIFGIFFIETTGRYYVEVQKALDKRRIDSVFYLGK